MQSVVLDNSSFSGEIFDEKIEITTNISPYLGPNDNNPDTDERKFVEIGEFNNQEVNGYKFIKDNFNNSNEENIYNYDYSGAFIIRNMKLDEDGEPEPIKNKKKYKIDNKIVIDVLNDKDGKEIKDFSNLQDGTYSGSVGDYITTENSHNYERILYKGGKFNITLSGNTFKGTVTLNGYKYAEVKKREIKDGERTDTVLKDIFAWKNETVEEIKNISGTIVNGKIEGMNIDGDILGRCLTGNEHGGKDHYMDWNVRLYIPNGTTHYANRLTMYFK